MLVKMFEYLLTRRVLSMEHLEAGTTQSGTAFLTFHEQYLLHGHMICFLVPSLFLLFTIVNLVGPVTVFIRETSLLSYQTTTPIVHWKPTQIYVHLFSFIKYLRLFDFTHTRVCVCVCVCACVVCVCVHVCVILHL